MKKTSFVRLAFLFIATIILSGCIVPVTENEGGRRHGEYGDYDEHHGEHQEHHEDHEGYGGYR